MNIKELMELGNKLKDSQENFKNIKVVGSTDLIYLELDNNHKLKYQFNDEPIGTTEEIEDIINLINKMYSDLKDENKKMVFNFK
jgi:predicted secreted protein